MKKCYTPTSKPSHLDTGERPETTNDAVTQHIASQVKWYLAHYTYSLHGKLRADVLPFGDSKQLYWQ